MLGVFLRLPDIWRTLILLDFILTWLPFEFCLSISFGNFLKCVRLRAKQVCALNLRQCDLRNAFMHGFWWMLREVGMLQQRKSNQTIMICRFLGNFFHYVFGVVLEVELKKGQWKGKMWIKCHKRSQQKNILCCVSLSIIIFNNVLLQLPIFYQTLPCFIHFTSEKQKHKKC